MENRYDKYKDSGIAWIGEIPEHWDKNKIIRLFSNSAKRIYPFNIKRVRRITSFSGN
ncbi:MAG: hypothetical protein H9802_10895 [Candidatus Phocaeicola faecipullorum]|nr:hypothetical protein [Candidatus Phocaeicola faecipullorum]